MAKFFAAAIFFCSGDIFCNGDFSVAVVFVAAPLVGAIFDKRRCRLLRKWQPQGLPLHNVKISQNHAGKKKGLEASPGNIRFKREGKRGEAETDDKSLNPATDAKFAVYGD